jgi:hypothetical protein
MLPPFDLVIRHGQHAYVMRCLGGMDTTFAAIQARLATHLGIPVKHHKLMCRSKVQPLEATLRDAGFHGVRAGDNNNNNNNSSSSNNNSSNGATMNSSGSGSGIGGHGKGTLLFRREFYSSENLLATLRGDAERATALLGTAATVTRRLTNRVTDAAHVRAFVVTANEAVLVFRAHLDETAKSGVLPRTSDSSTSRSGGGGGGGGGGGNGGTSSDAVAPIRAGAADDAKGTAIATARDELHKVRVR